MVSLVLNIKGMFESAVAKIVASFKAEGFIAALAVAVGYIGNAVLPIGYLIFGLLAITFFSMISGIVKSLKLNDGETAKNAGMPLVWLIVFLCLVLVSHTITLSFDWDESLTKGTCMLIYFYVFIKVGSDAKAITGLDFKEHIESFLKDRLKNIFKLKTEKNG